MTAVHRRRVDLGGGSAGPPFLRETRQMSTTFTAERIAGLPGPAWLQARRQEAFERFSSTDRPTSSDEEWKYSPIEKLDLESFEPAAELDERPLPAAVSAILDSIGPRAGVVLVRNGRVDKVELAEDVAGQGVRFGGLADVGPESDAALRGPGGHGGWSTHLHEAFLVDAAVLRVPRGVAVTRPFVVVQWLDSGAEGRSVFPRVVVEAGEQSELTLIDYAGSDSIEAYSSSVVELNAGPASNVRYLQVQDYRDQVMQTGHLVSRAGRDATVRVFAAALGGSYVRLFLDADLGEQGATTEIQSIYFGEGRQVHDFRSVQDHHSIRSTSSFLLKGAAAGESHGIYSGVIVVREGAKGTDAFLTNRNLVLSKGAGVDSIPNLEITNENDLKNCGHAAATGPVDEDQRFYLESRGVPTDVAERLIVFGFFDEVVSGVPIPGLRELLRQAVAMKLRAAETARG